jgi:trehalose-phosphatase
MRKIIQKIKPGNKILLFLDYDGTLVPIKKKPELAVLHPRRRKVLESLSEKFFVSVVSGRSLREIKKIVGIDTLAYIGNHGLEMCWRDKRWVHPEAEKIRPALEGVLKRLRIRTRGLKEVLIEDKRLTASIHYRLLAPESRKKLKKIIGKETQIHKRLLIITEGKRVYELRPKLEWDKGRGILQLIQWLELEKARIKVYVGDDRTDEDAFKALEKDGLTILVGRRKDSFALYRFSGVDEVWKFLKALNSFSPLNKS